MDPSFRPEQELDTENSRRNPILARDLGDGNRALGQGGTPRCYYPG